MMEVLTATTPMPNWILILAFLLTVLNAIGALARLLGPKGK